MPQHFSVEEANRALEVIRPLIEEILQIRADLLARQPDLLPVIEKASGNGGNQAASQAAVEFARMEELARQVTATGALLKDVNTGLVDFLSTRGDQEILLCWQYDEPQVLYWHTLEGGFAGRRPL